MPATEAAFHVNSQELARGNNEKDFSAVLRRMEEVAGIEPTPADAVTGWRGLIMPLKACSTLQRLLPGSVPEGRDRVTASDLHKCSAYFDDTSSRALNFQNHSVSGFA
jgi:hypothetical protein